MSPVSTSHLRKADYGPEAERKAFFGRRSAHKLHPTQQRLADELLPKVKLQLADGPLSLENAFEQQRQKNFIEIGYGGGEHLARQAQNNRDANYIGCEPFIGGIGKMLAAIDDAELKNVKLYTDDALHLIKALPEASFDGAYLLYPDPWPKKRHHKRRFVNPVTLSALARILKPGAEFRVATDIEDYATWVLGHVMRHDQFVWPAQNAGAWHNPWSDWQPTRYEQKARKEGRHVSFYFSFVRI